MNSGLVRSALAVIGGTVAGQAIIILSSPVLTRLYSAGEFGNFGIYLALLAFVVLISNFRYELAIQLPKSNGMGAGLVVLSLLCLLLVLAMLIVIIVLFGDRLLSLLHATALRGYLWMLPVGVAVGGAQKALMYWALRNKDFGLVARARVQQGAGTVGVQVLAGLAHLGTIGLLAGYVAGLAFALSSFARSAAKDTRQFLRVSRQRIVQSAWRYQNFPRYSVWSDMASAVGTQIPILAFASYFSPTVCGFYLLAQRVANAPAALVAEATGKVFMSASISAQQSGELPDVALGVFGLLIRIGIIPIALVAIIAPDLFVVVFGSGWRESGEFVRVIVPGIAAVFVFAPLSTLYPVLERQKADMVFQFSLLAVRLFGLFAGVQMGGALLAIGMYATGGAVIYLGFGFWLLNQAGVKLASLIWKLSIEFGFLLVFALTLAVAKELIGVKTPSVTNIETWMLFGVAVLLLAAQAARIVASLRGLSNVMQVPPSQNDLVVNRP